MLDDLRNAFLTRDYDRMLGLAMTDIPVRHDREFAEALYYQAYACCVFKARLPQLAPIGQSLIDRALEIMVPHHHQLVVDALINRASYLTALHDTAGVVRQIEALSAQDLSGHTRVMDVAFIQLGEWYLSIHPEAYQPAKTMLLRWLRHSEGPAPTFGAFHSAMRLMTAAVLSGDRRFAAQQLEKAVELPTRLHQVLPSVHLCEVVSPRLRNLIDCFHLTMELQMNECLLTCLRALHRALREAPHICEGFSFLLWFKLSQLALARGCGDAKRFFLAAVQAVPADMHIGVRGMLEIYQCQRALANFQPRPPRGELDQMLFPEAWPHWPKDEQLPAWKKVSHLMLLN